MKKQKPKVYVIVVDESRKMTTWNAKDSDSGYILIDMVRETITLNYLPAIQKEAK